MHCPVCGEIVIGRTDKIFCSIKCKSAYHLRRKTQRQPMSYPIDTILHRNWVVLMEAYELAGRKKFFANAAILQKAGFRPDFYTSAARNQKGKTYYYVYDFAWMRFSEKELMVIKRGSPS